MMLSVAEDGSLIQLVLFFDEDGSLMDLTVLMGHVYERYFELHPEEATPVTESTEGISYERDLLVEYIGGDVRLTWDNGACALPMSYGEFLHQGYPISEWAGFSGGGPASLTPDSMATACIWRDNNAFGSGNGNVDIGVKNYADVDLEPEFCMISDLSIWDVHTYENVCLTWNAPNGEFQITNEMTEADIVDQANRLGLNVISDPVQSSEHITKKFTADTGNKIEIITFFEPDGKFHGIHIFADNGQKQYFEQYPMQALPMGNGPDYNVEQVRAAMGFEMNVSWGEYSVTLPMPTEQYLAQGYQMQTMQFDDMMDPFEGYNAAFYHAAGGTSSVNYFIMNYTGAQLRQAHSLIVELQSMVEYSTRDMTVTVTFPEGTMTVSAGMTQAEVEVELARFGLAFSAPEPNISTRKVELMDQEGQAFIDVDFNEEGIVKYLRAWVDGFCAKYYGMNPTP